MTAHEPTTPDVASTAPANNDTSAEGAVVVGLDGSEHSRRALEWATANTSGPVRLVVSWSTPWWGGAAPLGGVPAPAPPPDGYFEESAKRMIEEVAPLLSGVSTLPALIRRGHAGQTLVEVAADSGRLLVVGSRGRGALTSTLLGSISGYCAAKSEVPVVVVPQGDVVATKRIVVGIDGSANSDAALLWAIDHGTPEATIVAVGAWAPPMSYDGALLIQIDELEAQHRRVLDEAVARAREARPAAKQNIDVDLQMGDPRHVLRDAAGDQLVIGARGHRGLEYLMMGSTASALVHQPLIPTVIVPSH